jgi:hypothetical protein
MTPLAADDFVHQGGAWNRPVLQKVNKPETA